MRKRRLYWRPAQPKPILTPQQKRAKSESNTIGNAAKSHERLPYWRAHLAEAQAQVASAARTLGIDPSQADSFRDHLRTQSKPSDEATREIIECNRQLGQLLKKVTDIKGADKRKQGSLNCLLFGYTASDEAAEQIKISEELIESLQQKAAELSKKCLTLTCQERTFVEAHDSIPGIQHWIDHYESAQKRAVKILERRERAKKAEEESLKKQLREKAIVAAYVGKARDLADDIKKLLLHQFDKCPQCPYCGGGYGEEPHADHIYPISKGGLSTIENMVIVCESCNLKKNDKTLREFVLHYGCDRTIIEENLQRLGKAF